MSQDDLLPWMGKYCMSKSVAVKSVREDADDDIHTLDTSKFYTFLKNLVGFRHLWMRKTIFKNTFKRYLYFSYHLYFSSELIFVPRQGKWVCGECKSLFLEIGHIGYFFKDNFMLNNRQ